MLCPGASVALKDEAAFVGPETDTPGAVTLYVYGPSPPLGVTVTMFEVTSAVVIEDTEPSALDGLTDAVRGDTNVNIGCHAAPL